MRWRLVLAFLAVVLVLLAGGGVWLYTTLQAVPAFYQEALAADPVQLEQANKQMLRRTATLNNELRKSGDWSAVFTQQEINGWLALDVPKNHPDLLPAEVQNPRVKIAPEAVLAGARYDGDVSTVISLELEVWLQRPNVVGVRLRALKLGELPYRLDQAVDEVVRAAREWGMAVEQSQVDGDPLLLITLTGDLESEGREVILEQLELRDGEVFVSGTTRR